MFVHHVVRDVKLDAQEKLFVLTIFSGFIGLCRVSIIYLFIYFVTFFLAENREAACFTEERST